MKSCIDCRHCTDVQEVDDDETQFRCTLPLPPWRLRWGDTISTLSTSPDGLEGVTLDRGDHMAEHCAFYEAAKSSAPSAALCPNCCLRPPSAGSTFCSESCADDWETEHHESEVK